MNLEKATKNRMQYYKNLKDKIRNSSNKRAYFVT